MSAQPGDSAPLAPEFVDAINESIQDEYYALFTYTRVVTDFGDVQPFSIIRLAEMRHSAAVGGLFTKRGLEIPGSEWDESNVPTFAFFLAACIGGKESETANIAMYDRLLSTPELPSDVRNVFTNLRAASLEQHLPAFERCINRGT